MGFDLHLGDHDGIAILCWSNRQSLDAARFVGTCSVLAIVGLYSLFCSQGHGIDLCSSDALRCGQDILLANHVGCCGRAIPKGVRLTLKRDRRHRMLTVGVLGNPVIGFMQEESAKTAIVAELPDVYPQVSKDATYFLGSYQAVDTDKVAKLEGNQEES